MTEPTDEALRKMAELAMSEVRGCPGLESIKVDHIYQQMALVRSCAFWAGVEAAKAEVREKFTFHHIERGLKEAIEAQIRKDAEIARNFDLDYWEAEHNSMPRGDLLRHARMEMADKIAAKIKKQLMEKSP